MDPLSKLSRLSGLLRQQLARQTEQTGRRLVGEGRAKAGGKQLSRAERETAIRADLVRRIRAVEGDDEQRRRKAARYFVESVLASELGERLAQGPALHELTRAVQLAMESDPELLADLNALCDTLIKDVAQGKG
jgi:hypothetical protein